MTNGAPIDPRAAVGWTSGSGGWSGGPHKVFIHRPLVRKLDGGRVNLQDGNLQRAKTLCEVCGAPVICDDWPTAIWRHMTSKEAEMYPIEPVQTEEAK